MHTNQDKRKYSVFIPVDMTLQCGLLVVKKQAFPASGIFTFTIMFLSGARTKYDILKGARRERPQLAYKTMQRTRLTYIILWKCTTDMSVWLFLRLLVCFTICLEFLEHRPFPFQPTISVRLTGVFECLFEDIPGNASHVRGFAWPNGKSTLPDTSQGNNMC